MLVGIILVALSVFELIQTYRYMFAKPLPLLILMLLVAFCATAMLTKSIRTKKNIELYGTALILTALSMVIYFGAYPMMEVLANLSPDTEKYEPAAGTKVIMFLLFIPAFILPAIFWRVVFVMKGTDPDYKEYMEEEDTPSFLGQIKDKITKRPYKFMDIVFCYDNETNQPVILKGMDLFLHVIVFGATGGGKTSRSIKPWVKQFLDKMKEEPEGKEKN